MLGHRAPEHGASVGHTGAHAKALCDLLQTSGSPRSSPQSRRKVLLIQQIGVGAVTARAKSA
eukprot:6272519-Prymnesium_polylepis.1